MAANCFRRWRTLRRHTATRSMCRRGRASAAPGGRGWRCASARFISGGRGTVRAAPPKIDLFAIEVRELDAPAGEEPILWRLLTTHRVETVAQALGVIAWYRQ